MPDHRTPAATRSCTTHDRWVICALCGEAYWTGDEECVCGAQLCALCGELGEPPCAACAAAAQDAAGRRGGAP